MTDRMELVRRLDELHTILCAQKRHAGIKNGDGNSSDWEPSDRVCDLPKKAAACIRDMVEWRPMETAPRDGTQIMMRCIDPDVQGFGTRETPHVVIGNWQHPRPNRDPSDGAWNVPMCDWWIGEHDGVLTHWLPLPPAPGAEDE